MKTLNYFFAMTGILVFTSAKSQVNIAAARNASVGSVVTIKGVVTNGSELGNIRYVQDNSAGISVYGANLASVNRKDSIIATGTLTSYNNLLEMNPVTFTVLGTNRPLPTPTVITPAQFGEAHEAQLMKIMNGTFSNGGSTFAGNTNYVLTAGGQTCQVRINTASSLVGKIIPLAPVNVTGIGSQFCSSPPSGCTSGYQMLPRDTNDIVYNSSIWLTRSPYPTNINTTSLTVNWNTNIAGTFFIKYGKTQNLEMGAINGVGTSATPSINITGATPATIYYVRAFSVNGTDTAKSGMSVFCTKSLSSGTIKTYFNRPVDNTVSTGTNAFHNSDIGDSLAAYIGRAKSTIDITIYNWDNSAGGLAITNALNAAYTAGKKIRMIIDGSTAQSGMNTINPGIKYRLSPQGSSYTIMHNKFVIIDANSLNPNDPVVWTGSTNWTFTQLGSDANNVIIFQDQSMARGYKLEFDEMWGDTSVTSNPNLPLSKFGQFKTDNTPHEYVVGGKRVESYFSPSDGTNTHILSTIGTANTDMYFGQLLITRTDLATKVASQITANSLNAKGILNDTSGAGYQYTLMKNVMQSNIIINAYNFIFHDKYLIVDQSNVSSDPLVLTGSHNWSTSGDTKNDENTVIVHDATIANIYYQDFHARWNEQMTVGIKENSATDKGFVIFPNPASDNIYVKMKGNENIKEITVSDMLGRAVQKSIGQNNSVSVKDLNTGVYFVTVTTETSSHVAKIVVEK